MLTSILLVLSPFLAAPSTPQDPGPGRAARGPSSWVQAPAPPAAGRRQAPSVPQRGIFGEPLGGESVEDVLGGTFFGFGDAFVSASPTGAAGIYHLTFNDTGTGWKESFLLGVPTMPVLPTAPLLVMFHGYGNTEWDCYYNTGLMKRALRRGWYVIAPRGAHKFNFSIPYAQANIEFVLDWARQIFPINPERVYGVGFSMGGGCVTNYAARHLDPAHARFAAVVNHTGTVSVSHVYWNSSDTSLFDDPLMFDGSPAQFPFRYQRSSVIDLATDDITIDPATDLARNLTHIPLQTWYATGDPLTDLILQSNAFHGWMQGMGAPVALMQVAASIHSWSILNEEAVLNFLGQQTLTIPTSGTHETLADRDGPILHFIVRQDAPEAFTPFRWNVEPALNRFTLDQSANLERLTVKTGLLGLDTNAALNVVIGTQDGLPEQMTLRGYPTIPSDVLRNGQSSSAWAYDPNLDQVTLFEADGSGYPMWVVLP